jgi:hypothetical protein
LSFARLEAKLEAHHERRQRSRFTQYAALAAAAALLVGVLAWATLRTPALTYQVDNGLIGAEGKIVGHVDTRVRFSDGSELALKPGCEAQIAELGGHGGRVRLTRGTARVAIAKKPGANWSVEAGPYTVRVTGTAFDVGWSAADQRFDLTMQSGSVVVSGPLAPAGLTLRAGQYMVGRVADGKIEVDKVSSRAQAPERAPHAALDAEPTAEAMPPVAKDATAGRRDGAARWSEQVAKGQFMAVIEQAEQRGLERTIGTSSLEDLSALADAARYARRNELARRALLAQRHRFSSSVAAKQAAFFLGRLSEGQGTSALEWYDRYLGESPQGSYVPQALGRKMMLIHQQHGATAARSVADDYLRRYPNGPYAAAARKIVGESVPAGP